MKVLITTAIYPTAENPGFGSFVHTQAESLRKAGVDVDVLVFSGKPRKLIYPKGVFQIRKRLASGAIQLIHAHYSYAGMVARTQFKVPLVVTFHGSDLLGTINQRGEKTYASRIATAAGRVLAHLADAVIVQTEQMARELQCQTPVHIIPCEVDLDVFQPSPRDHARAALGWDREKKYLLFAANPRVAIKRFPLAKQVAEELKRYDASVELLVACREPQGRLALMMSAADALIFPSYQEGSPNIVKQAMACNLPIVATDVGDVRQVIGKTPGCYICAPDASAFVARLREVLSTCRRTNGREQVGHLSGPAVAEKLIRVYEQTLDRWAGRRNTLANAWLD